MVFHLVHLLGGILFSDILSFLALSCTHAELKLLVGVTDEVPVEEALNIFVDAFSVCFWQFRCT